MFADRQQRLAVMSIAFLLAEEDDAVVWRGPKKNGKTPRGVSSRDAPLVSAMIKQFVSDVVWGSLDYLLVDTPPGTSDEHISTLEALRSTNPDGAVLVTTPQVYTTQQ